MATLSPILLKPLFRNRVWGGDRLGRWIAASRGGQHAYLQSRALGSVGEAWLLADLPATILDGRSTIAAGGPGSETLHDLLMNPVHRRALLGRAMPSGARERSHSEPAGFPLLVKVLDAGQNLSVQVHPTEAFSKKNPHAHMKSEMWLVLDASENAVIYRGIREEVTPREFRAHIDRDTLLDVMIAEPVRRGDCVWLPSGLCHALGAGVLVAEVQTPSDTTFRIWDWGRRDPSRPLHLDEAMECLLFGASQQLSALTRHSGEGAVHGESIAIESLVRTEYFDVERWTVKSGTILEHDGIGVPVTWTILEGEFTADCFGSTLCRGDTLVLPAEHTGLRGASGSHGVELLVTTIPGTPDSNEEFGGIQRA